MKGAKLGIIIAGLSLSGVQAMPPDPIGRELYAIRAILEKQASAAYKVELAIVGKDVFIDPMPSDADRFGRVANVVLTIDAVYCHSLIGETLKQLSTSTWKPVSSPGHPRAKWSIVTPDGKRCLVLLIESEQALVGVAGSWYKVDESLVRCLVKEFVDLATKSVGG